VSKTTCGVLNTVARQERTCALARANRVFCADEKRIRAEDTVMDKSKDSAGFYTKSSIARGCAFHPHAIDDPRGRFFVRAKKTT
jgi:hypothetical protein